MFELVRKRVAVSDLTLQLVWPPATLASFGWLLFQDQVHPAVVYLLQFYLSF